MKYGYVVVFCDEDDMYMGTSDFCICETEADAQEMILSLKENELYERYITLLGYDSDTRPEDFRFDYVDTTEDIGYKKIIML